MTWSSKDFYNQYAKPGYAREAAVVKQVIAGNTPSWLKQMIDMAAYQVMPDYLSIGTDDDWVRAPLTPYAAQYLANALGYQLPTPKMVELIYKSAAFKLKPIPTNWYQGDGHLMRLGSNYIAHNNMINFTLKDRPTGIVAGHKKDVVSDMAKLEANPHHVVIYGWDQSEGHPIQPETAVHDWNYEDYSHGIRFVKTNDTTLSGHCSLDAAPVEFLKLLNE